MPSRKHRLPQFKWAPPLGSQRHDAIRKSLLSAGALSSLLYVVATDGLAASMWDGYRRTQQMVSDLFAIGSPGRDILVPVMWVYTLLFIAFGAGVWNSVHGNRPLRVGGGLLVGYGFSNILGGVSCWFSQAFNGAGESLRLQFGGRVLLRRVRRLLVKCQSQHFGQVPGVDSGALRHLCTA